MRRTVAAVLVFLFLPAFAAGPAVAAQHRALFDNAHAETAGNADWEIDTHQPIPSPPQSGIGPNTPGTYWVGAISSWGVDLVKRGYTVTTNTGALTYQNGSNPYDLSNYDVLIVDEPNTLFSASETSAILAFVHDGGGLVAVSDHSGSDRNNDGSDSPVIWNALDPTHLLGVHFGTTGDANNNITQTSTNVNASPSDSVTRGPIGDVTGLAFHNGTTLTLYPSVNPTIRGEVWMTGLSQSSLTGVMAASSVYGSGRVVFVCDSSPADDGSAAPGNSSIFDGWGEAGATDSTLFLNATLWVNRRDAAPVTWTINASADSGGTIAPSGAVVVNQGASQSFTISAATGHHIADVQVDGSSIGAVAGYTFNNVSANHTIHAGFATDSYTLTVATTGSGSVTRNPDQSGYDYGTSVQLTANPSAGWAFTAWTGDTSTTTNPLTLAMTGNRSLSAGFADVAPPSVVLTSPVGGERWSEGSVHTIGWSASDNAAVDSVNVDWSANGTGGPWNPVAHGIANSGTYDWTVPAQPTDSAWVRVTAFDPALNTGTAESDSAFHILDPNAGVDDGRPAPLALERPAPNPGRGTTLLRFSLPAAGAVRLEVIDPAGRRVWSESDALPAGHHEVRWSGHLASGVPAGAGVYFVRLITPWGMRTQRLAWLQ